jgi:hypothetical protein
VQSLQGQVAQLSQALQAEKADRALESRKLEIEAFRAETERMARVQEAQAGVV